MGSSLFVRHGFLYLADAARRREPDGSVLCVDGTVVAVGPDAEVAQALTRQPADVRREVEELDATGTMVLPGLVNPHWHSALGNALYAAHPTSNLWQERPDPWTDEHDRPGLMAGGGDAHTVSAIFGGPRGRAGASPVEETRTFAEYGLWLQLRCGITTTGELGSGEQSALLGEAAREVGLRCVSSIQAVDGTSRADGTFERTSEVADVVAELEAFLDAPADPTGYVYRMLACGYSLSMSAELGREVARLVDRHDTVFATHVACFPDEAAAARRVFDLTPYQRLAGMGLLTERLLAVHGGFATPPECEQLLAAGVHLNYSPGKYPLSGESPATAGAAIRAFVDAGGPLSLSTDGLVLPLGGMVEAMQAAWQLHNQLVGSNVGLPVSRVLEMATIEGARALRLQDRIGSIEVGKRADLTIVPADDWRYLLRPRPIDGLLLAGCSNDVDTVVVDGEVVVRAGRSTRFDDVDLRRRYVAACRARAEREWAMTAGDYGWLRRTVEDDR